MPLGQEERAQVDAVEAARAQVADDRLAIVDPRVEIEHELSKEIRSDPEIALALCRKALA